MQVSEFHGCACSACCCCCITMLTVLDTCCLATSSPLGALLIVQSRGFGQSFQSYRYTALANPMNRLIALVSIY